MIGAPSYISDDGLQDMDPPVSTAIKAIFSNNEVVGSGTSLLS
jgi:hypothetical protein